MDGWRTNSNEFEDLETTKKLSVSNLEITLKALDNIGRETGMLHILDAMYKQHFISSCIESDSKSSYLTDGYGKKIKFMIPYDIPRKYIKNSQDTMYLSGVEVEND